MSRPTIAEDRRDKKLTAYVIVDSKVSDPAKYEDYKKLVPASLAPHGGRFLARGGTVVRLEGDWTPSRVVVIEFPSIEQAKAWYQSTGYTAARRVRAGAAKMHMIVVEGT